MTRFRGRRAARKLARKILASLASTPNEWKPCEDCDGLHFRENIEIITVHRRFQVFDGIFITYQGVCIWVPLLARLRLRRAVRCVLAEKAITEFPE